MLTEDQLNQLLRIAPSGEMIKLRPQEFAALVELAQGGLDAKPSAEDVAEAARLATVLRKLKGWGLLEAWADDGEKAAALLLRLAGIEGSPRANEGSGPVNEGSSAGKTETTK